ncbi:MAG: hypothetical protein ACFFG0_56690 [Candidatus Thorarchaeota archaeon]
MEEDFKIKIEIVPFGIIKNNFELIFKEEEKRKSKSPNLEPFLTSVERNSVFYSD